MTALKDSTPDILSISPEDYRRLCLQLEHRAEVQLLQGRILELEQDLLFAEQKNEVCTNDDPCGRGAQCYHDYDDSDDGIVVDDGEET